MKCKITDNGKLSIEFDIGSEEDIDAIVEELDLALKPSELRLLKNTLNAYLDVKNKVQGFLFDNETAKQPTIDVDEQTDGSDIVNTRAITLFSKLGYDVNDENVKILMDSFDELNRNKILSFASSTNPQRRRTYPYNSLFVTLRFPTLSAILKIFSAPSLSRLLNFSFAKKATMSALFITMAISIIHRIIRHKSIPNIFIRFTVL